MAELKTKEEMVAEFIEAFGQQENPPEFWLKLVEEEYQELREAYLHYLKELCDLSYVAQGFLQSGGDYSIIEKYGDVAQATVALPESRFLEAYRRVHRSNMSKLGPKGKPLYREDGKVLKGPHYEPPNLEDLI